MAIIPLSIALIVAASFVVLFTFRNDRRSIYRGRIGEALVIETLERCAPKPYFLINNVTLRAIDSFSPTTQIDHILVIRAGIFVIETKHYSGRILGNPTEREWEQIFRKRKIFIRNPIFQNSGHVKELESAGFVMGCKGQAARRAPCI
jgi:hypothetical protein